MKIKVTQELNVPNGHYCNKRSSCYRLEKYENSNRYYCSLFDEHLKITPNGNKKCERCLLACHEQCGDE